MCGAAKGMATGSSLGPISVETMNAGSMQGQCCKYCTEINSLEFINNIQHIIFVAVARTGAASSVNVMDQLALQLKN